MKSLILACVLLAGPLSFAQNKNYCIIRDAYRKEHMAEADSIVKAHHLALKLCEQSQGFLGSTMACKMGTWYKVICNGQDVTGYVRSDRLHELDRMQ